MDSVRFKQIRARIGKTQKELARLLGISIKAVHSYEQGRRKIPHHVERQLLFLFSRSISRDNPSQNKCWEIRQCPEDKFETCPAWEFNSGDLCWFINGTKCGGKDHSSWEEKMEECGNCNVFKGFFRNEEGKEDNA